jgi:hypothetical protein
MFISWQANPECCTPASPITWGEDYLNTRINLFRDLHQNIILTSWFIMKNITTLKMLSGGKNK